MTQPKTQEQTTLLHGVLLNRQTKYPAKLAGNPDKIFEFFCVDTLLTDYDLNYDELDKGIVDGSRDGGIDAAFLFVDQNLFDERILTADLDGSVSVKLIIIQSKNSPSFKESAVTTLSSSLSDLFDLSASDDDLRASYREAVVDVFLNFKNTIGFLQNSNIHVDVSIQFFYCTKAVSVKKFEKPIIQKINSLKKTIYRDFGFFLDAHLLGVNELYARTKKQKTMVRHLACPDGGRFMHISNAFVSVCRISDFSKFVSDERGAIMPRLLEANVRGYQSKADVNKEMKLSLTNPTPGVDFWWLNNGVTIVADDAIFQAGCLQVKNPLIVNGLQTTHEIHHFINQHPGRNDQHVLVRIIVENDDAKRGQIIRATNRQTRILPSSFRSTDKIHIDIEEYLFLHGYYYDRKKNFYKNQNKTADKIITIDKLAQFAISVVGKEPHIARSKPTTIVADDPQYNKYFSSDEDKSYPLSSYLSLILIKDLVDNLFDELKINKTYHAADLQQYFNNLKFHVMMVFSWELNGNQKVTPHDLSGFFTNNIFVAPETLSLLDKSKNFVFGAFSELGAKDKIAKDGKFTTALIERWFSGDTDKNTSSRLGFMAGEFSVPSDFDQIAIDQINMMFGDSNE